MARCKPGNSIFLKVILFAAVVSIRPIPLIAWEDSETVKSNAQRNVLFIAVDDLRPQLNCYGKTQIQSPNIDQLAADGMLFERAYCQQAVCGPSRASVLSGARPDTTGIYGLYTRVSKAKPELVTLPRHFKSHGYETIGLGKIYHHADDDPNGWSKPAWRTSAGRYQSEFGKEREAAYTDGKRRLRERLKGVTDKREISRLTYSEEYYKQRPYWDAGDVPDNAYPDGQLADRAIRELRRIKDDRFFLAVGFVKPHLPFNCPKKYWDLYKEDDLRISPLKDWPDGMPSLAATEWNELRKLYLEGDKANEPEHTRRLIHGYCACVSYADAQIGRLIDELDALGLRDNTVIVLWGDHGWKIGDYSAWCKHTNFEVDAHTPLIINAPGYQPGQRTKSIVELLDIYPTLVKLAGLPVPEHCEGTSLIPLLDDPAAKVKDAAFSQYPRPGNKMGYSIRTSDWRYTEWIDRKSSNIVARELYDHRYDQPETINVADDSRHTTVVEELSARVARYRNGY